MEGAPEAIDSIAMKEELEKLQDGTVKVEDFHIWSLSKGMYVVSSRILCNGDYMGVLKEATKVVNDFGITAVTL